MNIDEGLRVWARAHDGCWHLALVTWPSHARTACAKTIEAIRFEWPEPSETRPAKCPACEARPPG